MLYDHPLSQLHMKKPFHRFLSVLVITGVPFRGIQSYRVGFQKLAQLQFISRGRDCQGLEENLHVSDL